MWVPYLAAARHLRPQVAIAAAVISAEAHNSFNTSSSSRVGARLGSHTPPAVSQIAAIAAAVISVKAVVAFLVVFISVAVVEGAIHGSHAPPAVSQRTQQEP